MSIVELSLDFVANVVNKGNLGRRKFFKFVMEILHDMRMEGLRLDLETLSIVLDNFARTHNVMPQFDWLCDVCGCVMSSTSGIYWINLGFINNYKEPQLWLVLLRYNADVTSAFPWVVTYGIELAWYPYVGSETLPHKVGLNEDVRDLSGGDCDALIWLIMWCVWVCDESYIGYLLGWLGFY